MEQSTKEPAQILVIDDDESLRRLVALRLAEAGHKVVEASNGARALELLSSQPFELVLLDIIMPGGDGYEVLKQIRARHRASNLPVIMLSARDKGPDVIDALRLGANDYAVKPIDWPVLMSRIDSHLALASGTGNVIGNFRVVSKLGAGAMGAVFSAIDRESSKEVALKILPRSLTVQETYVERFMQEAELASRVSHKNVVTVLGAGRDGETYYIIMELVRGKNIAQVVRDAGPIELSGALGIARQMAAAIHALHEAGIVHRDLKPENVMVADEGTVKLTDFGIAHDTQGAARITRDGQGVGSLIYSSPEQMEGKPDLRSDIYSLGATLFFMLSGRDPFDGNASPPVLYERKRKRPPSLDMPSLPPQVDALVTRLLEPKPRRRFQTPAELSEALDNVLTSPVVSRRGVEHWQILVLVGVAAAVILGWWLVG